MFIISFLEVDSIDGSSVDVLDLSVASGNTHKGVSTLLPALLRLWNLSLHLFKELDALRIGISNLVDDLGGFDLSHFVVEVKGALSDWDNTFNDVPEDTLVAWSGGQRSRVGPSLVEVNFLDELLEVQLAHVRTVAAFFDELDQESIVPLDVGLWVSDLHFFKVLFWHDLEEETEDTGKELGVFVFALVVEEMDDVHFQIEQFSVNGVLTGRMEMELNTMESGLRDVSIEE